MAGRLKVSVAFCTLFVLCRAQWNSNPSSGYPGSNPQYGQQGGVNPNIGGDRYNTDRYNNYNSANNYGSGGVGVNAGGGYGAAGGFGAGGQTLEPFQSVYEWFRLDYNWIDEMTKQQAMSNRRFIPENNAISGVKVWRDRIFVTIPRWKDGVPVTMASIPRQPLQPNSAPRLEAFPNWQMQEIGNCSALQNVKSMEIDSQGRMWIIDSGRINTLEAGAGAQSRCPPKLVIIDLNSVNFGVPGAPGQFGSTPYGNPSQPGFQSQYPNQPGQTNQIYPQTGGQYPGQQNYNNPNQQYPNNQNLNNQYSNNPQYPNSQYPNNPNQPYTPSGQYNPTSQYNNPSGQYNRNQYGSTNQYNQPGGQYNQPGGQYNSQYPNQYNNTPRYDQFGNPIPSIPFGQPGYNQQPGFNQGGFNQGVNMGFNALGGNVRIIKSFTFPSNVATQFGNNLNDIVLDDANGGYAYISDHSDDPGIIVYSFREDRAWKVKDARSMRSDPDVTFVSINNIDVEFRGKNIYGIALSAASGYERTLYFSPLGSNNLYSLPTSVLKNSNLNSDVSSSVKDLGRKQSISGGMICDNRGNLYFGLLGMNAVGVWNTARGQFSDSQRILARDNRALQWPDSFGIDDQGSLYVVTNRLQNYITGRVNLDEPNYRILRAPIGGQSYQAPAQLGGGIGGDQYQGGRSSYDSSYGGYNAYGWYNEASSTPIATGLILFVSTLLFIFAR